MSPNEQFPEPAANLQSLLDLASDSWRYCKSVERIILKVDPAEQDRHRNQLSWFTNRIAEVLAAANLRLVDIQGQRYDPGIAATPINIGDFPPESELVIDQMLEPIIMGPNGLLRSGTVTLRALTQ